MNNNNISNTTFYINTSNTFTSSIPYKYLLKEPRQFKKGDAVVYNGRVGVVVKQCFPYALVKFETIQRFCELEFLSLVDNKVEDLL